MANLFDLNVIEQVNLHKLKISRIGTYYYVIIYLLSLMYMIRLFSSRAYFYVNEKTGRKVSKRKLDMIMDKRLHAILFLAFSYIICTIGYFNIDVLHLNSYEVNINKKHQKMN
ncbi:MAG: hypothetical protein IJI92_07800 [Erysipelotrichaceae bacterium]|nr:hypothetical protein [Erysipelotrichaceae bacterium]